MTDKYTPNLRDGLAHRLACASLRIGTPTYRAFVRRVNERGMQALADELDDQMDDMAQVLLGKEVEG